MPYIMAEPVKPAKIAWKSKASEKMRPSTWGSSWICSTTTISATSTYMPPMNGTRVDVTFMIRLPPPMRQYPTRTARIAPMTQGVVAGS